MVEARDEARHPPGSDPGWEESWEMNFVSGDGRLGGYVRLALRPHQGRAWYWAAVAGVGRPLVAVRDHDVELPRGRDLEVRGSGLWAQLICETPLDHWSTGLEAFAVAMNDPTEAYQGERGDPVALGFDLEWEEAAPAQWRTESAYVQPCVAHGDVLVGRERVQLDGHGGRSHRWGPRLWSPSEPREVEVSGRLDGDGATVDVQPATGQSVAVDVDERGLLMGATWRTVEGVALRAEPMAHAPVGVPGHGAVVRLPRALVRLQAGDGRTGAGWVSS